MILGGCGASLEELTGLYASLSHEGVYRPLLLTAADSGAERIKVMSPAASFMINDILSRVNRPDFPLTWSSTAHLPKIAWKTGTSYGRRDAWSIGYNNHFTIGVWVGNFSGKGSPALSGASMATPLLFQVFNTLDYDNGQEWFRQPPDCDTRIVCSETGLPPSPACTDLVSDFFIPLVSSAIPCQDRQQIAVAPDEKMSYCRYCKPALGYKEQWYRIFSPSMRAYYDEHHIAYKKIPPHNPACEAIFGEGGPAITYPPPREPSTISAANIPNPCNWPAGRPGT